MSENKGHIEFRKNGETKFYAPDRDILYLYPIIMKAALASTAESCSEESYKTFPAFVKAVADIHNKSITTEEEPAAIIEEALRGCRNNSECYKLFTEAVLMGVFTLYIKALRDSVERPTLTEAQLEAAVKATRTLALLPRDIRELVKPYILMATGAPAAFGENNGLFTKEEIKKDENAAAEKDKG